MQDENSEIEIDCMYLGVIGDREAILRYKE